MGGRAGKSLKVTAGKTRIPGLQLYNYVEIGLGSSSKPNEQGFSRRVPSLVETLIVACELPSDFQTIKCYICAAGDANFLLVTEDSFLHLHFFKNSNFYIGALKFF